MADSSVIHVDTGAEDRLIQLLVKRCDPRWYVDLPTYASRLIGLVYEAQDRPITEFSESIHMIVREHSRPDHGDVQGKIARSLDRHVKLLIDTLEQVRQELSAQGHWSDMPVPPLMCG